MRAGVHPAAPPASPHRRATPLAIAATALVLVGLSTASVLVGASELSLEALLAGDDRAALVLAASRLPRTLALLLTGAALAVVGVIMQQLVRNRFVEPTTTGTAESAALGLLVVTLAAPTAPLVVKMLVACGFALLGTVAFLALIRRVPARSSLMVPLLGIMLGGVIGGATTLIAYRTDLLQTLGTWMTGDFSGVMRGRYELLLVAAAVTALAMLAADRFTIAGLGSDIATTLGLPYRRLVAGGLAVVAVVTATVVVTAGVIPFLGLVVPAIVRMRLGDDGRRSLPWTAALGAAFVLACDLVGRLLNHPYEIPLGIVVGVVGGVIFLVLLLRSPDRAD